MELEIPERIIDLRSMIFAIEQDIEFWEVSGASILDIDEIKRQKSRLIKELDSTMGL